MACSKQKERVEYGRSDQAVRRPWLAMPRALRPEQRRLCQVMVGTCYSSFQSSMRQHSRFRKSRVFLECLRLRGDNSPSAECRGMIDRGLRRYFCVWTMPRVKQSCLRRNCCGIVVRNTSLKILLLSRAQSC